MAPPSRKWQKDVRNAQKIRRWQKGKLPSSVPSSGGRGWVGCGLVADDGAAVLNSTEISIIGHTAAAGLVVASHCRLASTRGRCERCGQCASRSAALRPLEGSGFGGCATAMKISGRGLVIAL